MPAVGPSPTVSESGHPLLVMVGAARASIGARVCCGHGGGWAPPLLNFHALADDLVFLIIIRAAEVFSFDAA